MGNRPQGSKLSYMGATIFFAILMGYMLFCAGWLTYQGVQQTLAELRAKNAQFGSSFTLTAQAVFANPIFRNLIVSSVSTYGVYLLSSLLFMDFMHMFTSFVGTTVCV